MRLSERQINAIARWLHRHQYKGSAEECMIAWGEEFDYADEYQNVFRAEARRLADELLAENAERETDTP